MALATGAIVKKHSNLYAVAAMSQAMGIMVVTAFMLRLDSSSFSVVLPSIMKQVLGNNSSLAAGLAIAYCLPMAASLLVWGRLADHFGPRWLIVSGSLTFAAGLVGCALPADYSVMLLFRVVGGLGNAMLMSGGLVLFAQDVKREHTSQALGWCNTAWAVGAIVGPVVGGWMCQVYNWRVVLALPVPLALLLAYQAYRWQPPANEEARPAHQLKVDGLGSLLLFLWLGLMMVGFNRSDEPRLPSVPTGYFFFLSAVLFVVWLHVERRSLQPLVDVTLFATNRSVRHAVLLVVTPSLLTSGITFFVPVCLLQWLQCTPVQIGWVMILYPVTRMLTGPVAGRLADRGCAFRVMQVGLLLFAVAFFGFVANMGHASLGMVVVFMVLVGAANSCLGPVATAWLMNRTPRHQQGMVSGLYQTLNVVSNMMGVCLFESLYSISHDLMFGCHFVCLFGISVCVVVFWTVFGRRHSWTEATDFAG